MEDLVEWQDGLEQAGVGAPTVIKAMSILSSVFREAARRSWTTGVRINPVVLLDKLSGKRRRRPLVWGRRDPSRRVAAVSPQRPRVI